MTYLPTLGWTDRLQAEHEEHPATGASPARVVAEYRGQFSVIDSEGEPFRAEISGRMRADSSSHPAVGDWVDVRVEPDGVSIITRLYPRTSQLSRKAAGRQTRAQIVAANIDVVFIATWPTGDFSSRRIERYLTAVWDGGASPVIVLTKVDLCDDLTPFLEELSRVAIGVAIEQVCALDGTGMAALEAHLGPGRTGAFVGSSGVGKSTLVNAWLGDAVQPTGEVRKSDDRGRHVTTHRELFVTPNGILIDTPGMRELGLWAEAEAITSTYVDIDALAASCRFGDCTHEGEPGCAVASTIKNGELGEDRLAAYHDLERERAHTERKRDAMGDHQRRQEGKRFARLVKEAVRIKGRSN